MPNITTIFLFGHNKIKGGTESIKYTLRIISDDFLCEMKDETSAECSVAPAGAFDLTVMVHTRLYNK